MADLTCFEIDDVLKFEDWGLRNMNIRTTHALLAICNVCSAWSTAVAQRGSGGQDSVKPFQSDLWQLEYREDDDERRNQNRTGKGKKDRPATVSLQGLHKNDGRGSLSAPMISDEEELEKLQQDTPFDEWEVDASLVAEREKGVYHNETSVLQLSRATAGRGAVEAEMNGGPTLTTFLVGIVACIVMTGAIFSGKS